MKLIIVRPITSIDSKISFSNMHIINNCMRNSMGQHRLNSLVICSIHGDTIGDKLYNIINYKIYQ